MEQEKSAREILAYIERNLFKGIDLDKASRLEGEERKTYRLSQVERLLAEKHGSVALAVYLSDMFWTADEGRELPEHPNPLLSLKNLQMLTKEEMAPIFTIDDLRSLKRNFCGESAIYKIMSRWNREHWIERVDKTHWKKASAS